VNFRFSYLLPKNSFISNYFNHKKLPDNIKQEPQSAKSMEPRAFNQTLAQFFRPLMIKYEPTQIRLVTDGDSSLWADENMRFQEGDEEGNYIIDPKQLEFVRDR
jgi:hypothetical protein